MRSGSAPDLTLRIGPAREHRPTCRGLSACPTRPSCRCHRPASRSHRPGDLSHRTANAPTCRTVPRHRHSGGAPAVGRPSCAPCRAAQPWAAAATPAAAAGCSRCRETDRPPSAGRPAAGSAAAADPVAAESAAAFQARAAVATPAAAAALPAARSAAVPAGSTEAEHSGSDADRPHSRDRAAAPSQPSFLDSCRSILMPSGIIVEARS
jgi:hypothetical protein